MTERQCPWCAETIRAEAIKCRHCGSRLDGGRGRGDDWHRDYPERKIAGVCAAIARNLDLPVFAVRAVFVVLTLFHAAGAVLYVALWFLMPREPGAETGLDRALDVWHSATDGLLGHSHGDDETDAPRERRGARTDPLDRD